MVDDPGRPAISLLVVDDDDATLGLIATFLRRNGYRVLATTNPLKGLELLQAETVALVITDLNMPYVDGITFTERIHQLPGKADLPVIMMTAYGSQEITDQGMRKGVALTLGKPIELARLLDLVGFATAPAPS
jgi:two-component system, chemotaxis family, chemotaxis protein CheY